MEKYKAIPAGYMTVGELAKKMGTTVRTLQYYHKEKLLVPSAESDGGRRLYTDKDLIKLHQILSLKHLGFSLEDIKSRLLPLESSQDVANILAEQAEEVKKKIEALSNSLKEIEMLRAEVLQIQTVDFKKYADIIVNLQMKNEFYWLIKHFDDQMLDHIRTRFDVDSGNDFMHRFMKITDEILEIKNSGEAPDSAISQEAAKRFWDMVLEFTKGDLSLLPKLEEIGRFNNVNNEWAQKQASVNAFIEQILDVYFTKLGAQPYEGRN